VIGEHRMQQGLSRRRRSRQKRKRKCRKSHLFPPRFVIRGL
jgi:hypothetical protein